MKFALFIVLCVVCVRGDGPPIPTGKPAPTGTPGPTRPTEPKPTTKAPTTAPPKRESDENFSSSWKIISLKKFNFDEKGEFKFLNSW